MRTSTRSVLSFALVSVAVAALVAPSTACHQQAPQCSIGRGDFIARYTFVSGPGSCRARKGEKIGAQAYSAAGEGAKPDLDKTSVALEGESLGLLVDNAAAAGASDPDPTHKAYAFGGFTTAAPVSDFCEVPGLSKAQQVLPAVAADADKSVKAQPATKISYEWTNLRVYVTTSAYGTQFTADLLRTENSDVCVYQVQGMYPYVDCSAPDPNDPKKSIADESACAPEADPAHGRATGSGINPDFPVRCDPELLVCVLTSDGLPVLR
jgi:hypothetical protein